MSAEAPEPILQIKDLHVRFPVQRNMLGRVTVENHAVSGVDLDLRPGETLGLVGESGCGKTTLGRTIVGAQQATSGSILYDGHDLTQLKNREKGRYRRQIRMVFQDPFSSLNPRMTLRQIIGDPLVATGEARGAELEDRVADMMRRVGLSPDYMDRYPHAFSGGQRQRVNIARALIVNPKLVVADEPVSALDVSVRAQILNLLRELQADFGLTYLFISHDLSVVENIADRVAVMYFGRVVELADTASLYEKPSHPYTEALMSAVPIPDPALRGRGGRILLPDELPDPANPPPGCAFARRCRHAEPGRCDTGTVDLVDGTRCVRRDELDLQGIVKAES
ncbi:ABC transporter ATP-binding protein [Glycomyces sp. NRRL B-16210]|uniref:ABC transporter ATP-binding protein n=1 Tax=Glycomyces sp. NRRL B-16210 TaxID=1463821 RepID=UPI0009DEF70D|nr:oligopeptide/dipeptide ABC transporter ATP-binding protein [Glycomyces sp. NRRL B-16210]